MPRPTTQTMKVTPAIATKWLESNTHNRPVRDAVVKEYASQMAAKKWLLNGEAIIFDENGVLADGQHRLWACVEADVPFETVVVEGVSEDAFATIDTGKKRSASDVIAISGVSGPGKVLASAGALALRYRRGTVHQKTQPSHTDILTFVERNGEFRDWCEKANRMKGWTKSYAALVATALFFGAMKYPGKAEEFLTKFASGEGLDAGSPILALRNRLGTEKRLPREEKFSLVVQAWNAFVANRTLARMQLARGDKFPTIAGAVT